MQTVVLAQSLKNVQWRFLATSEHLLLIANNYVCNFTNSRDVTGHGTVRERMI